MAYSSLQRTIENGKVITFLNDQIGEDILYAEYSIVIDKVNKLDVEEKTNLLTECVLALSDKQLSKNVDNRISVVRVMVALLPMSLGMVANLLNRRVNKYDYEVHFTLFCYLDWVQDMPDASSLTKNVLLIVENYLMTVPRKTARAVWMAGDMLGAHWNEQEAIPVLIRTAQSARHSVGRQGGILGLDKMLDRLPRESETHKSLLKTLYKISLSDHSMCVKREAKILLKHWRGPLKSRGSDF